MLQWIKLDINISEDDKIMEILEHDDGYSFCWLWINMICLSMKSPIPGFLLKSIDRPYNAKALSHKLRIPVSTVERGCQIFLQLQMICINNDVIEIINFEKWQNVESINRQREISRASSKRYRDRQRQRLLKEGKKSA